MYPIYEDSRSQLISKGKFGEREKTDNKTRYEKRVKSKFANNVRNYNKIDMNKLFKENILTVNIDVHGETDDYITTISFGGFLDNLKDYLEKSNNVLDLRVITRALIQTFNSDNVYLRCECPDFYYRFGYWCSKTDIITGEKQNIPSNITNPHNKLGPGCKHLMLVLSNTGWIIKVASVLNNYIHYMEKYRQQQYADIIYPAIYGKKYEKDVQTNVFGDEAESDEETLNKSNEEGRVRGRFSSTYQPNKNKNNL